MLQSDEKVHDGYIFITQLVFRHVVPDIEGYIAALGPLTTLHIVALITPTQIRAEQILWLVVSIMYGKFRTTERLAIANDLAAT